MAVPVVGVGLAMMVVRGRPQDDLLAELSELRSEMKQIASMKDDLEALKVQFVSFEPRLTQMELDYEQIRRKAQALERRILWLEAPSVLDKAIQRLAKPNHP